MIVLIDGDCALCVGLVEWLGKRIPAEKLNPEHIMFVPGESDWGTELLREAKVTGFDSVVVLNKGEVLQEGAAVLALAEVLPRRWKVVAALGKIVPRLWRNAVYRQVARNRISWFGRKEVCAIDSRVAGVTYGPRGLLKRP
ncbi:thiol-disulfide oxidoreductase DCC family protein [Aurantimicrobium minutum]|uniref:thiol-disulfide oxidoreductase DCC family protein n=1 Tax=Aurantimicrobium minutum TaxID=708131 RepID=UPI00247429FA|nr:DCC1-like thiol-disulfide oxidoreductase family protein [Aurantimicrobium minutum]MDH6254872.1 putative DCC family thiol-disulfide oxidoreductase YuxK [Aurantimicrobium minutum]